MASGTHHSFDVGADGASCGAGNPAPGLLAAGASAFWSIALFRWDINIREFAVLGVGAGGVGVALDTAMNLLYWDQVAVVLIASLPS